jgi:hypothetical protein
MRRLAVVLVLLAAALRPDVATAGSGLPKALQKTTAARPLRVSGNRLVNDSGRAVQLRGVNRSSPETRCLGTGVTSYFLGPVDAASVTAMRSWGANAVRIPVNEDCWLGRNGLPVGGTAADYRAQITSYVRLLVAGGLNVVVDVHFAETTVGGVTLPSYGPAPMLDKAYGPALWRSIATTFRTDKAVLFDLYNEPHSITWECWRDGCGDYAGMQELVTAVRSTGATNPIVLTGPSWGNEIGRWLEFTPTDPARNLVAGVHIYPTSGCATRTCVDERVLPVAAEVPVVVGEFGDTDCAGSFLEALPAWADPHGIGYLAFTWNAAPALCSGYHLITAFDGAPTPAGAVYRRHLLALTAGRRTSVGSVRLRG